MSKSKVKYIQTMKRSEIVDGNTKVQFSLSINASCELPKLQR